MKRFMCVKSDYGFSNIDTRIVTSHHNSNLIQLTQTYSVISYTHFATLYRTNFPKEGCDANHNMCIRGSFKDNSSIIKS